MTLGLVVDASGFVIKSRIFAGNVAESKTLAQMIQQLGGDSDAVVVMDRGVADEANLSWLKDNGYRYVVVSREQNQQFESQAAVETLITASKNEVSFYKEIIAKVDPDGNEYFEAYLRCHSTMREHKENGILSRFMKRFEEGIDKINETLSKPNASNKLELVERRLGRLQKQNSRVARHYQVDVHGDESGTKATRLSWRFEPIDGTMWYTYMMLIEVEAVFRSLKSELGLRPIYHHKPVRHNGHLFISVIAYQAVCVLRTRMKANGYHDSWTTVRDVLRTITRTTTSFERQDGRTLHVRKTAKAMLVRQHCMLPWAFLRRLETSKRPSFSFF